MQNPYLRLIRFDKPIGTLLLLWPTLWAVFIAGNGRPPLYVVLVFSLGVFLTRSAGCAINDYVDANFDKHVKRTKNRPLAEGVISKNKALAVCACLSIIAFIMAYMSLKPATLWLSIPALIIFVTYPFTKRFFVLPQAYLGVAFSFGILMAFVEIQGHLSFISWLLFAANLFWVIGYDTIYALVDIEDDVKIGIRTSAITFGTRVVPITSVCYIIFALLMAYIGHLLHLNIFFWLLWLCAGYSLLYQIKIISKKMNKHKYFAMFLSNNKVGYIMFFAVLSGFWK